MENVEYNNVRREESYFSIILNEFTIPPSEAEEKVILY